MDLFEELQIKTQQLDTCIKSLRNTGSDYAEAYKNYRIALRQELLRLREQGVPSTIISDIARGDEVVAELKKKEIEYEAIYRANIEAISSIRLDKKIIDNQIAREYVSNS